MHRLKGTTQVSEIQINNMCLELLYTCVHAYMNAEEQAHTDAHMYTHNTYTHGQAVTIAYMHYVGSTN